MPSATPASPPPPATSVAPVPLTPLDDHPVDGAAALFAWTALPEARSYQLQIARTASFEDLHVDVPVGPATSLTLYDLLPEDGTRFFWRVQGRTPAGLTDWSKAVSFRAANNLDTNMGMAHWETVAETLQKSATSQRADNPAVVEELPPYMTGKTSSAQSALLLLAMVVSFILTISLIVFSTLNTP